MNKQKGTQGLLSRWSRNRVRIGITQRQGTYKIDRDWIQDRDWDRDRNKDWDREIESRQGYKLGRNSIIINTYKTVFLQFGQSNQSMMGLDIQITEILKLINC